jgi:putative nucleotidyltransferase with HDIG domain
VRTLRVYVSTIIIIGGAALAASLMQFVGAPDHYGWALFAALSILTSSFTLNLGTTEASISVADTFFITSALLYGPAAGALTIAADSLVLSALRRRHGVTRGLFNTLGPTLSMFVAAKVFFALAGIEPLASSHAPVTSLIVPLTALAVVYFSLNCGIVAGAVALESKAAFLEVWRKHFLWLAIGYFAAASLAFCLVLLIQQSSLLAAVIVLPLLGIFHLTLRASFGRLDDARSHLHAMDRLYLSTIETLAMAIDAKDDVTHSHVRRVQQLAMAVAREMGISNEAELKALEAAALMHDTGKLAVPEHILNKPGGLTDAEFDKMKLHVDIGADILSLVGFPFPVVPIVRCHHENWDGSGYPNGIAGEAIPVGARILSVVDCFDALTSDRPYRKRLPDEAAVNILRERSGRMYDPAIVDTFIRIRKDIVLEEHGHAEEQQVMRRITRSRNAPAAQPAIAASGHDAPDGLIAFVSLARLASGDASQSDVLAMASHLVTQVFPGVSGAWFVPDAQDRLVANEAFGPAAMLLRGTNVGVGERLTGWVAATRQMIVNSPAALDLGERASLVQPPMAQCLSVPLIAGERLVAVLTLYSPAGDDTVHAQRGRVLEVVAPHIAQALAATSEPSRQTARTSARDLRLVASAS